MKSLRLLVTKKIDESLRRKAGENGIEVTEKDFIRIELLPVEEAAQLAQQKITAIFTSKNAVKAVGRSIPDSNDVKWKIFCLAGATQTVVKKYFPFSAVVATAWNGAALAQEIIASVQSEELFFFCGNKRRNEIPDALEKSSIPLKEIVSYKTVFTPMKVEEKFDAVAFFSPTAVESFFSLNVVDEHTVCFSVGNTTSGALEKYSVGRIITLPEASEKSLIDEAIKITNKI
jgi:uroporphyrinogen-III synthase